MFVDLFWIQMLQITCI